MWNKLKLISLFASIIVLTGCASMTGYTPVVDTYGDRNVSHLDRDYAQCQDIAQRTSSTGKEILTQGGTGALIGGAGGAALGAIFGDPAIGAAAGAAALGIGGAAKGGFESDDKYKRVFRNCMRNRGHHVLD